MSLPTVRVAALALALSASLVPVAFAQDQQPATPPASGQPAPATPTAPATP